MGITWVDGKHLGRWETNGKHSEDVSVGNFDIFPLQNIYLINIIRTSVLKATFKSYYLYYLVGVLLSLYPGGSPTFTISWWESYYHYILMWVLLLLYPGGSTSTNITWWESTYQYYLVEVLLSLLFGESPAITITWSESYYHYSLWAETLLLHSLRPSPPRSHLHPSLELAGQY